MFQTDEKDMERGAGELGFRDRLTQYQYQWLTGREVGHCNSRDPLPLYIFCNAYNILGKVYRVVINGEALLSGVPIIG